MEELNINVNVWDMTNGRTDSQLKEEVAYNQDLEDVFRRMMTKKDELSQRIR